LGISQHFHFGDHYNGATALCSVGFFQFRFADDVFEVFLWVTTSNGFIYSPNHISMSFLVCLGKVHIYLAEYVYYFQFAVKVYIQPTMHCFLVHFL